MHTCKHVRHTCTVCVTTIAQWTGKFIKIIISITNNVSDTYRYWFDSDCYSSCTVASLYHLLFKWLIMAMQNWISLIPHIPYMLWVLQ